jgi:hypothetical protein
MASFRDSLPFLFKVVEFTMGYAVIHIQVYEISLGYMLLN